MGGTLSQYYWVFVLGGAHDLCILSDLTKDYIGKKITPVLRRNLWSWRMKACKNSVIPGLDPWHLCDIGRALYPINRWSPLQFVSTSRSSNRSYSYIYYLIEVYATGIFFCRFQFYNICKICIWNLNSSIILPNLFFCPQNSRICLHECPPYRVAKMTSMT